MTDLAAVKRTSDQVDNLGVLHIWQPVLGRYCDLATRAFLVCTVLSTDDGSVLLAESMLRTGRGSVLDAFSVVSGLGLGGVVCVALAWLCKTALVSR